MLVGPLFSLTNSTLNRTVGSNITVCSIQESNPTANISFTTTATNINNVVVGSGSVTIMSSTINNTGNYTCTANSGQNSATQTTTVCVGGKLLPLELILTIYTYYRNTNRNIKCYYYSQQYS